MLWTNYILMISLVFYIVGAAIQANALKNHNSEMGFKFLDK